MRGLKFIRILCFLLSLVFAANKKVCSQSLTQREKISFSFVDHAVSGMESNRPNLRVSLRDTLPETPAQPNDTMVKRVYEEVDINKALAQAVKLKRESALLKEEILDQIERKKYLDSVNQALEAQIRNKNYELANKDFFVSTLQAMIKRQDKDYNDLLSKYQGVTSGRTVSKWERRGRQRIIVTLGGGYGYAVAQGWPVQRAAIVDLHIGYKLFGLNLFHR